MVQPEHVGMPALDAERTKLLQEYDAAVIQGADDPVSTEHGVSCEAHFRAFLNQFLPKKYGVTKGYIITPDQQYAGPLEEWDVVIYDAMEAPVLFVRRNRDEAMSEGKRGIPVEYVRGVVEVKATFNRAMAKKAASKLRKLRKLRQFLRPENHSRRYDDAYLPSGFRAFATFFETKVANAAEYEEALGELATFWRPDPLLQFSGALIIRGQTCPAYSASTSYAINGTDDFSTMFHRVCEVSKPVPSFVPDMNAVVLTGGYGPDEFWRYMIDLVHALNGHDSDLPGMGPSKLTGAYGQRRAAASSVRLFPPK